MDSYTVNLILDRMEDFLRRNLILSAMVINKLKDNGIITESTKWLMMKHSSLLQADTLISVLRKADLYTFQKFIQVLKDTHNNWVADTILDTPIDGALVRDKLRFWRYDDVYLYPRDKITEVTRYVPVPPSVPRTITTSDRLVLYRDDPLVYRTTVPRPLYTPSTPRILYNNYTSGADRALTELQKEEYVIKDLLHKNARDQSYVYQNQRELRDIDSRLYDLHLRAREIESRPIPITLSAKERLSALYRLA